jgi:hypothetical protein
MADKGELERATTCAASIARDLAVLDPALVMLP